MAPAKEHRRSEKKRRRTSHVVSAAALKKLRVRVAALCYQGNGVCGSASMGYPALGIDRKVMARPILMPVALCLAVAALLRSMSFTHKLDLQTQQLRALETATLSTGLSMAGALPAFATWGEGSEPGQNIDPARGPSQPRPRADRFTDSTEYYNRKVLNATAICLTFAVFLFGLVVSQARKLVENKWLN
ncbi:unnamed protein product [Cladocopium goreaui]|uniref:Uncharacterized protein n=1 Tax=Cladocopium goreaui TaxID=2562237 RepID=A0A9P1C8I7_9DINO|nr:unnamed protein product [Cladocopium goreaui]